MNALRIVIPLALGLIAGLMNYFVVRGMAVPLTLVVVKQDVKEDTVLKPEMLGTIEVRADSPAIFKSAVPASERGAVLDRRVNRALAAGEVLLFHDVRTNAPHDLRTMLREGEDISGTIPVPAARVAPGLQSGDFVSFVVATIKGDDDFGDGNVVGPFRLLWVGERSGDSRQVVVAIPKGTSGGTLSTVGRDLIAAAGGGAERRSRVLAVEYARKK